MPGLASGWRLLSSCFLLGPTYFSLYTQLQLRTLPCKPWSPQHRHTSATLPLIILDSIVTLACSRVAMAVRSQAALVARLPSRRSGLGLGSQARLKLHRPIRAGLLSLGPGLFLGTLEAQTSRCRTPAVGFDGAALRLRLVLLLKSAPGGHPGVCHLPRMCMCMCMCTCGRGGAQVYVGHPGVCHLPRMCMCICMWREPPAACASASRPPAPWPPP